MFWGGGGIITCTVILYVVMFHCFSLLEHSGLQFQRSLNNILHEETASSLNILHEETASSHARDDAASLRTSANADLSTALKCLASGGKPVERLNLLNPEKMAAIFLTRAATSLVPPTGTGPMKC